MLVRVSFRGDEGGGGGIEEGGSSAAAVVVAVVVAAAVAVELRTRRGVVKLTFRIASLVER